MTKGNPPLSRTDTESVLRQALYDLAIAAVQLQTSWVAADPATRGTRWAAVEQATEQARKALRTVVDPKRGQCAITWFDDLDAMYDRCGLPLGHKGDHSPEYIVKGHLGGQADT